MKRSTWMWAAAGLWSLSGCQPANQDDLNPGSPAPGERTEPATNGGALLPDAPDSGLTPGFPPGATTGLFGTPPPPARLPAAPIQAYKSPPPISGGGLVLSPGGEYAVVADLDRDLVDVVHLTAGGAVASVALPPDSQPGGVALDAHGQAHVAQRGGGLARIGLATAELLGTSQPCKHPRGVAYDAAADSVFLACLGGDLVELSAVDHTERSRTFVAEDLRDVIVDDSGLYVSRYRTAELIQVHADGSTSAAVTPPAMTTENFPSFFEDLDGQLMAGPIEPQAFEPMRVRSQATLAWRTASTPKGMAMLHQRAQVDAVAAAPGGYGGGSCGGVAAPAVTLFPEDGTPPKPMGLGDTTLVVDSAVSPDGRYMAVAAPGEWLQGRGTVKVYDLEAVPEVPPGEVMPCQFPTLEEAYDEQVVAVAFTDAGDLVTYAREPARVHTWHIVSETFTNSSPHVLDCEGFCTEPVPGMWPEETWEEHFLRAVSTFSLPGESVRDTGHDLFHANVGGGMACASCHGEATDDAHVWDFEGIGPRRTQNMRGGLLGTEPFHWEGDMEDFGMLVHEVMTGRMGGFEVAADMQQSLAEWIDRQPALVLENQATAASERGRALFESAGVGCTDCHSGEKFTNNLTVDVGTGGLFQVPSLLGLGWRAPYMHDGCAATLMDRFDPVCGGGDMHGTTSQLSEVERADLVAYLTTL